MRVRIAHLKSLAPTRPTGFLADYLAHGIVSRDGAWLEIAQADYDRLVRFYSPNGAGDRLAAVLKPLAVVSDTLLGTALANCARCQQRQQRLNEVLPFK